MKIVLFLCTGNYYRSRFAEEMFNFAAPAECTGWRATSRGIAVDLGSKNVGPIAVSAAQALQERGVTFDRRLARMPLQVEISDLEAADHIVAAHHVALGFCKTCAVALIGAAGKLVFLSSHDPAELVFALLSAVRAGHGEPLGNHDGGVGLADAALGHAGIAGHGDGATGERLADRGVRGGLVEVAPGSDGAADQDEAPNR